MSFRHETYSAESYVAPLAVTVFFSSEEMICLSGGNDDIDFEDQDW